MWKCKKCNEELEDQFEICWNCGSNRQRAIPTEAEVNASSSPGEKQSKTFTESDKSNQRRSMKDDTLLKEQNSDYKVLPLYQTDDLPNALQRIIDSESSNGWRYVNHQYSDKLKPGNNGCFGIGASPTTTIHIGVIIFEKTVN